MVYHPENLISISTCQIIETNLHHKEIKVGEEDVEVGWDLVYVVEEARPYYYNTQRGC